MRSEREVPQAPRRDRDQLLMVGDSLAEGTAPLLRSLLPGWQVRSDFREGRPLAEGMAVLSRTEVPAGSVLGISLFTNDGPGATDELAAAVRASAAKAGAGSCVVWATIVRPPVGGVSYDGANRVLRAFDGTTRDGARIVVVDWAELIARQRSLLAPDGVHATPQGYQARAQLYADAARAC